MLARAAAAAAARRSLSSSMATEGPVAAALRQRVLARLAPVAHLELENESHKHSRGAGGESHFKLFVVSPAFEGVALLQRHRMVMDAVKEGSTELPVHALSIQAKTPAQWMGGAGATLQATPPCKSSAGAPPPRG
jgi:BolA protein